MRKIVMIGSRLGPYQLLEKPGHGGMGDVYKARHLKLGRIVALKVLASHLLTRLIALLRFEREMLAVGSLHHPSIVQAQDAGEADGVHYLSIEYVDGQDLGKILTTTGPMSVIEACESIRQASLGLAAAHRQGLVHRDIKPSNLFVTKQTQQIKILDLRLALLSQEASTGNHTSTGQCFGTPDYMAPEQWEDAHTCDARADLYALGCTLFALPVGRPLYGDDTCRTVPRKMKGHVSDPIPDLLERRPDVPQELDLIYRKLMAMKPEDRFDSADQLAEALTAFCNEAGVTARLPQPMTETSSATSLAIASRVRWLGPLLMVSALSAGRAANFENVFGGSADDGITGNAENNLMMGNGGSDTLAGGDGSDELDGGDGDDLLKGGNQDNVLIGGIGDDYLKGEAGNDSLNGGDGFNTLVGGVGNDLYTFQAATVNQVDTVNELVDEGTDTLDFSTLTTVVTVNLTSDTALAVMNHRIVRRRESDSRQKSKTRRAVRPMIKSRGMRRIIC